MKALPILFTAQNIRWLIADRKTQTRRVVSAKLLPLIPAAIGTRLPIPYVIPCPYGTIGDLLWVREAVCTDWSDKPVYKADDPTGRAAREAGYKREPKYRSAIHMPRWASRLTLRITNVRVQRLQEIDAKDAWAEGIDFSPDVNPIHDYEELWESINGAGSWKENSWVWAISFEVIKRNVDAVLREEADA